jgi:hypothetical protein
MRFRSTGNTGELVVGSGRVLGLENHPQFRDSAELVEVRRLYDAGEINAAFNLLTPIVKARVLERANSKRRERGGL